MPTTISSTSDHPRFQVPGLTGWTRTGSIDAAHALATMRSSPDDLRPEILTWFTAGDDAHLPRIRLWVFARCYIAAERAGIRWPVLQLQVAAVDAMARVRNRRAAADAGSRAKLLKVRKADFLDVRAAGEHALLNAIRSGQEAFAVACGARELCPPASRQSVPMTKTKHIPSLAQPAAAATSPPAGALRKILSESQARRDAKVPALLRVVLDQVARSAVKHGDSEDEVLALVEKFAVVQTGIDETRGYPTLTIARHRGGLLLAMRETGPVIEHAYAAAGWLVVHNGIADWDLQDLEQGVLTIALTTTDGTDVRNSVRLPLPIYVGDYERGRTYAFCDVVTHCDALWIATVESGDEPGASAYWEEYEAPNVEENAEMMRLLCLGLKEGLWG